MRIATWICGVALALLAATSWAAPKRALGITVHGVQKRVKASQPLTLRAKLQWRGPKADFTYAWSSKAGPALPFSADRHSDTLAIPAGELMAGEHYELELEVTAKFTDPDSEPPEQTAIATSTIVFDVNAPPSSGSCKMDVKWQGPSQAWLTLEAPGWKDDDGRVQYRYTLIRNGKSVLAKNWSHSTNYALASLARPGDKLQTKCTVRDQMGDEAEALSDEVERPQ